MKVYASLEKNLKYLKKALQSEDVCFMETKVGAADAVLIFAKDIVDKESLGELVLRPLSRIEGQPDKKRLADVFLSPEKEELNKLEQIPDKVVSGFATLICDGVATAFSFGLIKFDRRSIAEPPTSTVIKGPREGFVESLPINISMMRRRLKTPDLIFENIEIGKYSKTTVCLCYVKNVADRALVKKLKAKLNSIEIDAVLDSSYVSKFLGEHKTSVFKQVGNTEKPDILAAKILEGRVALLVDGSPIALTVPYLLIEDFQSPNDYYSSPYNATLSRLLRLMAVMLSILLPAFYVSAQLFHLQIIPLSFLLTIVNSIKGIPLSPSYEMFFSLLIFEILNEASVRMPKYVGMVVSIVGGLVLGETAVNAGIISAPTLMIIALSGICLFTVPELEKTFAVLRLVFLIIGGSTGGYGILVATASILIYLVSFENYSTPLMAPFSPLIKEDLKDSIYKGFMSEMASRPLSIKNANHTRLSKKDEEFSATESGKPINDFNEEEKDAR